MKKTPITLAILVVGLPWLWAFGADTAPATGPAGDDWPQYRGANRDGRSAASLPAWGEGGLKQAWSKKVGAGFANVAVVAGRVYTTGGEKDTDTVWCLDAATGKEIWKHTYPCKDGPHPGTRATPTVAGGRLYGFSREGMLYCLDAAKGTPIWQTDTCKELAAEALRWGMGSSVLIEGKLAVVSAGTCGAAFDIDSGKLAWRVDSKIASFATPLPLEIAGKRCILFMAGEEAVCTLAADGKVLWRFPFKPSYPNNCADPVLAGDGQVFFSSAYDAGCALVKYSPESAEPLWQNKKMNNHFATSLLWKGSIIGCDGDFRGKADKIGVRCLDLKTGDEKWSIPLAGTPVIAGDKLLILTADGTLVLGEPLEKEFKELCRFKALSGQCWTAPVVAAGRIYCRNAEGDLVCLEATPSTKPAVTSAAAVIPGEDYLFQIEDFNGALGVSLLHRITKDELVIVGTSTFEGVKSKVLARQKLTDKNRQSLNEAIGRLRLQDLKDTYENPSILDGTQVFFDFHLPKQKPRRIEVMNTYQKELNLLIQAVNSIAPKEYAITTLH